VPDMKHVEMPDIFTDAFRHTLGAILLKAFMYVHNI